MYAILGILRFILGFIILLCGLISCLSAALYRRPINGAPLIGWVARFYARALLWLLRIKVTTHNPERMENHVGFLFPNHASPIDIIVLYQLHPLRFLATHEVRRYPFIGPVAIAMGSYFVDRTDKASRTKARQQVMDAHLEPPLSIFPEGKIPQEPTLAPFRHGAFEIAASGNKVILPAVIAYSDPNTISWKPRFIPTVWDIFTSPTPYEAELFLLEPFQAQETDDHEQLAEETHAKMYEVLSTHRWYQNVLEADIS